MGEGFVASYNLEFIIINEPFPNTSDMRPGGRFLSSISALLISALMWLSSDKERLRKQRLVLYLSWRKVFGLKELEATVFLLILGFSDDEEASLLKDDFL